MAELPADEEGPAERGKGTMELDHCLKLLKGASSDTEKMAGLLVVAKMIKSNEIDGEGRRRVFETVGFAFLSRLLATKEVPEGCVENPYHKIAVAILACFCTDEQLTLHPQLTCKIPLFNSFVQTRSTEEGGTLAEDSLQCLRALSCSPEGIQYLLKYQSLQALVQAYLVQNEVSEEAKDVLVGTLGNLCLMNSELHLPTIFDVVTILSREFKSNQAELKFKLCDTLSIILSLADSLVGRSECSTWLKDLACGLTDILSSKVTPKTRESALKLSGGLSHLLGIEWAVQNEPKFLLLWLNLVFVEVRIATEGKELEDIAEKSPLLCSCFIILERAIVYVSQHSGEDAKSQGATPTGAPPTEVLLKLHTILTEALTSVVHLLTAASRGVALHVTEGSTSPCDKLLRDYPIVAASVRVLGAWLAEDSLTLVGEVYSLLPFLLDLCATSAPTEEDGDLLKFLLPGLCHMTVDDKARPVLLTNGFQRTVFQYMEKLLPLCVKSSEMRDRLCLCCGVLMHICVCAPGDVRGDPDHSFSSIASLLVLVFTNKCHTDVLLVMNTIVLFLMITRRKGRMVDEADLYLEPVWCSILKPLLNSVQTCPYVLGAKPSPSQWEQVADLWLLGTQELCSLAGAYHVIQRAAASCGVAKQLSRVLAKLVSYKKESDDEEFEMVQNSVCTLLQTFE